MYVDKMNPVGFRKKWDSVKESKKLVCESACNLNLARSNCPDC